MVGLLYLFLLISLFVFEPSKNLAIDRSYLACYLLVVSVLVFSYVKRNHSKNWFRLDYIFLFGFLIVFFQWPLMLVVADITPGDMGLFWSGREYTSHITYGTWLALVGILSWSLGATRPTGSSVLAEDSAKGSTQFNTDYVFYITLTLFVLFVVNAGSDYLSGAAYRGEVESSHAAGISVYVQLLFTYFFYVLISLTIYNMKSSGSVIKDVFSVDKKIMVLFSSVLIVYLLSGDRGFLIQPIFVVLILYGTLIRPVGWKAAIGIVCAGAILVTIIGLGRGSSSGADMFVSGKANFQLDTGFEPTLELANSARTLYRSLNEVPNNDEFFLGKLWVNEFLALVPMAQSEYLKFSGDSIYELSSSKYLTYKTRGPQSSWGEGTSIIADIYLNFGVYGVLLFMYLFGVLIRKVRDNALNNRDIYGVVILGAFAAYVFYISRGGIFYTLRPVAWSVIITFILIKISRRESL